MSKSASSTLYAFGLNSYITPCVADAILINSEDIGQLWIFGPRGRHGARVGHGGKAPGERQEHSHDSTNSCPVYTPFTHSVNAITQHLGRVRCSPLSMLDPRRFVTVEFFENHKDKGLSDLCSAKLDPPRQCPGDRPRVQRAVGAPRGVPSEHPLGQAML